MPGTTTNEVTIRLQALEQMTTPELRQEWRHVFRIDPPKRVSRHLLLLGIAWKIQERAFGGLKPATKRRLAELANGREGNGDAARSRIDRLKPGVKLIREWQGEVHQVVVLDGGFEWQGQRWRSLSVIARQITQAHWSGPRFFGLNGKTVRKVVGSHEAIDG